MIASLRPTWLLPVLVVTPLAVVLAGCGGSGTGGGANRGGAGGPNATGGISGPVATGGSGGNAGANGTGGNQGLSGSTGSGGVATGGAVGVAGHGGAAGAAASAGAGGSAGIGASAGAGGAGGGRSLCGGSSAITCASGFYCYYVAGSCGSSGQTGTCRPQVCSAAYSPVCGCDGKTYSDSCEAALAGTSVGASGECPAVPGTPICGGIAGATCPAGQYCRYSLAAACGRGDQAGICAPIPSSCAVAISRVCGCNGKTYDNACLAAAASVAVAGAGECIIPDGTACGGPGGTLYNCGSGKFCKYSLDAGCGTNAAGVCSTRPTVCTTENAPVCGCNLTTYSNACLAAAATESVRSTGAFP